jgi:uncharacterized membrane protein
MGGVSRRLQSVIRTFFTLLALSVVALPVAGWIASAHGFRWGTVPEWIAAIALVFIAVGVWRLVHLGERERATARVQGSSR